MNAAGRVTPQLGYGNVGPAHTSGKVQITAVTPFTVNIDRTRPLPHGCRILLEDQTVGTPEIVACTLPRLHVKEERFLRLPLVSAVENGKGPTGLLVGPTLIAPVSTQDVDVEQTDNLAVLGVAAPSRNP